MQLAWRLMSELEEDALEVDQVPRAQELVEQLLSGSAKLPLPHITQLPKVVRSSRTNYSWSSV